MALRQSQRPSPAKSSGPATAYLIGYNALSAMAWAAVLLSALRVVVIGGEQEPGPRTRVLVQAIQTTAVAEVAHAAIGLVHAAVAPTAMQVASRLLLVWAVVAPWPQLARGSVYTIMLLAWSASETVRYGYFAVARAAPAAVPPWLLWLRYSAFLVLYPIGITCECLMIWRAVPEARRHSGALAWAFLAILAAYVPGSYVLYTHMLQQRRKILSKSRRQEQKML